MVVYLNLQYQSVEHTVKVKMISFAANDQIQNTNSANYQVLFMNNTVYSIAYMRDVIVCHLLSFLITVIVIVILLLECDIKDFIVTI